MSVELLFIRLSPVRSHNLFQLALSPVVLCYRHASWFLEFSFWNRLLDILLAHVALVSDLVGWLIWESTCLDLNVPFLLLLPNDLFSIDLGQLDFLLSKVKVRDDPAHIVFIEHSFLFYFIQLCFRQQHIDNLFLKLMVLTLFLNFSHQGKSSDLRFLVQRLQFWFSLWILLS